jgi:hypothetical protein
MRLAPASAARAPHAPDRRSPSQKAPFLRPPRRPSPRARAAQLAAQQLHAERRRRVAAVDPARGLAGAAALAGAQWLAAAGHALDGHRAAVAGHRAALLQVRPRERCPAAGARPIAPGTQPAVLAAAPGPTPAPLPPCTARRTASFNTSGMPGSFPRWRRDVGMPERRRFSMGGDKQASAGAGLAPCCAAAAASRAPSGPSNPAPAL